MTQVIAIICACKTTTCLYYIVNIVDADDLATKTQGIISHAIDLGKPGWLGCEWSIPAALITHVILTPTGMSAHIYK